MPGFFGATLLRIVGRDWSTAVAKDIEEAIRALHEATIETQQSPGDPSTIQAGAAADPSPGDSSIPSLEDHVHPIETGAAVGLGNANAEGSGSALARSTHVHKRDARVAKAGSDVGTRNRLNFIEGTGVTLDVVDDPGNDEVDVTIAATTPDPEPAAPSELEILDFQLYQATSARYALTRYIVQNFR